MAVKMQTWANLEVSDLHVSMDVQHSCRGSVLGTRSYMTKVWAGSRIRSRVLPLRNVSSSEIPHVRTPQF